MKFLGRLSKKDNLTTIDSVIYSDKNYFVSVDKSLVEYAKNAHRRYLMKESSDFAANRI
jgi:hypothetical protein